MSLHKFAEQVAQHGRGDDSLLVHMTPDEVQRLQKFAEANGRSLTINPTTGLPEAGMLSDLFKAVAPIALGAFLGPGAFGIAGLGLSAGTAGLITGGLTTLATGSLSRGLMAGLGAYGGAGLAQGFADAGANALGAQGTAGALGVEGAATGAGSQAAMLAEQTAGFGTEGLSRLADSAKVASGASPVMPSSGALMSKGLEAAGASPMQFAKDNWKSLAAAAAPIMAGAMVPTTTSMPTSGNTGFIRQKIVNPDGTVRDLTPVKASEWGSRNFSDVYRGYNGGGIVALAGGGSAGAAWAAANNIDLNKNINQWIADNPNASRATIDAEMNKYGISQDDVNRALSASTVTSPAVDYALSHGMGLADINQNIANFTNAAATKNATDAQIDAAMQQYGISNEDVARALKATGGSQGEQYALLAGNMGLSGLNTNINNWLAANPKATLADAQAAMSSVDINEADVKRATGKTLAELFPPTKVVPPVVQPPISVTPGETKLPGATVYDNGAFGNYGSGPATGVDYLGRTVSIATPGDIITNPDQTRTVVPNIPGRPYGGFTGMDQVKSAYTAGGGSLGYTSKAPRTIAEFDQLYNKQTGDSLAAYNYLMGKGAYPTKSGVGEISRPYREATLGYPASTNKMYNWDPVAGKMVRNPDYVAPGRDANGNVTYGMSLNDIKKALSDKPLEGQALYDWAMTNNLSAQDIADATGMKLSEVYAQFRTAAQAAAKKTADDKAAGINTLVDTSGGGDAGGPGGPGSGGDAGPGGVGGAGGPGSTSAVGAGDVGGVDAVGGYYSRGKLNYRSKDMAMGGATGYAMGGGLGSLGSYSDGGRLLKGPGDGVSDSIPATIGAKQQPARLADGEFVIPARIVSELGNGSTDAGAKKLYAMMDRVQRARGKTTGKNKVAANTRADKYLPA